MLANSPLSIIPLHGAGDASICGHKAATLASLLQLGFEIPPGFVIPTGARPTATELAAALGVLGGGPVAVRSSGVAEDLADASFAGQYLTVLDVVGAEAVLAAVERVLASVKDARTRGYVDTTGAMAVLVQRMIAPKAAGVAFSANPLTGAREVVINATAGLAEELVAGVADGDEWIVSADGPRRSAGRVTVLDAVRAEQIATLARRVEMARGAPQDVEWALDDERLWLLQARPITTLPVKPEIEIPTGSWQKDASHFSHPVSPFAASTHLVSTGVAEPMLQTWGLMPDAVHVKVIGHEFYVHIEPDDGGGKPPPWWVLGIAARLIPSIRRKLKAAQRAVDGGLLESIPRRWREEQKPEVLRRLHAYAALDLTTLTDAALSAHLDELCAFSRQNMQLHFLLNMPHVVGLFDLATFCDAHLGWTTTKTLGLIQGLSHASMAVTRDLEEIAAFARTRPAARAVIEDRSARFLDALDAADVEVAARVRAHLRFWGLRTYGAEAGQPSVAERPELVAAALADLLDPPARATVGAREVLAAEARAALPTPELRAGFDALLRYAAEVAYPLREDNVIVLDHLPVGLLRRVALEMGRRLVARGALRRPTDAVMLRAEELKAALVEKTEGLAELVQRRKAEHAWVRAHPGPAVYGNPPGPLPDLRGLPEPARRLNGALLWELSQEWGAAHAQGDDAIGGIAASNGVYRGRVRVIRSAADLHHLQAGEVLVCPETSSAWMMVFGRAGALVTDHGSTLSHTAIVAREFGLPAVVATANGTTRLRNGDEVIVDGNSGIVTRIAVAGSVG